MKEKMSFVKKLPIFSIIAALCCIIGLVSILLLPFGKVLYNLDIDFVGGTTMQYNMHKTMDKTELDKIAKTVEGVIGSPVSSIQKAGKDSSEVIIKTKTLETKVRDKVFESLKAEYNLSDGTAKDANGNIIPSDILSVDNVDAVMGRDLRNSAILAAFLAIVLMLIYISFRFDFKSGLAAVISLVQDILVMLSVYVILQIPMNMNFIAAALTILGYSINATIIVFDRVRENRKILRKVTINDIVDTSIWQTLTRSINTTVTTVLTIGMVFIFGVPSIRDFSLPIIVGVLAGLYSSVFLSAPVWSYFINMGKNKKNA